MKKTNSENQETSATASISRETTRNTQESKIMNLNATSENQEAQTRS